MIERTVEALVPSVSISALLGRRDVLRAAVLSFHGTYEQMHEAATALGLGAGFDLTYDLTATWGRTHRDVDRGDELELVFKRIDAKCWSYLLAASGLEQLMDHKQRAEWRKQLDDPKTVPDFTYENISATFTSLAGDRQEIFERGVENVFRSLSWSYKTNNPVLLGKRIVVTHAAERMFWRDRNTGRTKWQGYGPSHSFADKLDDLVRAFCVLEGKPEPGHDRGAWAVLSGGWMQEQVESGRDIEKRDAELHGYLRFRGHKNGNAHVTFLRLDLVDQLNKIIAKRFPNALPPQHRTED